MSEEEFDCEDCWSDFAKRTASLLKSIEKNQLGKASVELVSAMERLIEDRHHCPPGMIGHHWSLRVIEGKPTSLGCLETGEHHFYIDDAADLMDVPEETKEATLETINESWDYMEMALMLWREHLSDVDEKERLRRIKVFRVVFTGALFLRSWGLWHNRGQEMPKHLDDPDQDEVFDFFSQVELLNRLVRAAPGIEEYHHFNMTGEWPDKND